MDSRAIMGPTKILKGDPGLAYQMLLTVAHRLQKPDTNSKPALYQPQKGTPKPFKGALGLQSLPKGLLSGP